MKAANYQKKCPERFRFRSRNDDFGNLEDQRAKTLGALSDPKQWQNCLAMNALLREVTIEGAQSTLGEIPVPALRLYMVTKTVIRLLVDSLERHMDRDENVTNRELGVNISGLNAFDIIISRPAGRTFEYRVDVATPSFLEDSEVEYILEHGLMDVPAVLKEINAHALKYKQGHIYRRNKTMDNYRMPDELVQNLYSQCAKQKRDTEIHEIEKSIEENLNELPSSAFENNDHLSTPIGSLEV